MKVKVQKKTVKTAVKLAVFLLIFAVLFYVAQALLQSKWLTTSHTPTVRWMEYRTLEEDTVDVLYLGTSHVYCGVDPFYIYENSGITGYVLAESALRFDLIYMGLEEALKTQSPSIVFLDMSPLQYTSALGEEKTHWVMDQLPLSLSKIRYALTNQAEGLEVLDLLFPFFRYHDRWESLTADDISYLTGNLELTYTRGHYVSYKTVTADTYHFYKTTGVHMECNITEYDLSYFYKICALCEENDIELILFKIPTPYWYQAQSDVAYELAEEMGLFYWELYYEIDEIGLDRETDFQDSADHVNQSGAEKISDYIMQYLLANYNLTDQRDTNQSWNEALEAYHDLLE